MKNVHVFVPVFLYAVTMLIFQIKRIISSEKWFNYVVTFFLKMPKIWVGRTTLNGEKKEDSLIVDINLPSTTAIGQLYDDVPLLQLPECFSLLFSCAN